MNPLSRLERAHAEFDRLAAEILQTIEENRVACTARSQEFRAATRDAIAACEELEAAIGKEGV